ncbi:hypothetical protein B8W85_12925, partial [Lentilactobacillus kefiri]
GARRRPRMSASPLGSEFARGDRRLRSEVDTCLRSGETDGRSRGVRMDLEVGPEKSGDEKRTRHSERNHLLTMQSIRSAKM